MIVRESAPRLWEWWRRFSTGSVNQRIFSAALIVAVLTFAVYVVSLLKEIVVAASFGVGDAMDAFLIALVVPQTAIGVVANSFNSALIPTYIRVREQEGQEAAQRLFASMVVLSTGLLVVIAIAIAVSSPMFLPFLASGYGPEKLNLTQGLLYALLPAIVINGIATTWGGVLNAGERFALVAFAPAMIPLVTIAGLVTLRDQLGIYTLAYGMVAGFVFELCVIGWALRRQGIGLRPAWHGRDAAVDQVIGQYLPLVAGQVMMSSALLVDQAMASALSPGSVAALSYGSKIVVVLNTIITTALAMSVTPYFSKMIAVADWTGVRHTLKTYSWLTALGTIVVAVLVGLSSELIIRLLLERGSFTASDTLLVAQIQVMFALGIPFYALAQLLVRLISSLRANVILMWGTLINAVANIGFNYLFMQFMGVSGIALSTSLVYFVSLSYLAVMVHRQLRGK